jgi:glycosyltransferase involved in cell wall biosynthesis
MLLSAEPVGSQMRGSAIRSYELARALAVHTNVVLAAPHGAETLSLDVPVVRYDRADPSALRTELEQATVVVGQPPWPHVAAALRRSSARLIFDLYDPEPFEILEFMRGRRPALRRLVALLTLDRIKSALRDGDHLMCASEKQRDLWLGALLAQRLIGPEIYDRDPTLRSLIDVVPFGASSDPPRAMGPGPRESVVGVGRNAELVLWNGGIWSWLDAPTAIRAIGELSRRRPNLRLVFMGADTEGPGRRATLEARTAARELGLLDRVVFFHDGWVPYERRADWLLEADCAVVTHVDHLETRFAFRTRILDCFWAGVPAVCTLGDELAERVDRDGLGKAVPERDPPALAAALDGVLDRGRVAYAAALATASADFAWPRVTVPLVRWVLDDSTARPRRRPVEPTGEQLRNRAFRKAFETSSSIGIRRWPSL